MKRRGIELALRSRNSESTQRDEAARNRAERCEAGIAKAPSEMKRRGIELSAAKRLDEVGRCFG